MSETGDLLNPPKEKGAGETPATPPTPVEVKAMAKPSVDSLAAKQDLHKVKIGEITGLFNRYEDQLKQAAPALFSLVKREIALLGQLIAEPTDRGEKLRACSPASIFGAGLTAATSGLSIAHKHYAIIPRGGQAVFELQYQGILQLMRNAGDVAYAYGHAVREGDLFDYELGLLPDLKHKEARNNFKSPVIAAYAVVVYKDGNRKFHVLWKDEIEYLRMRNPSQKNGISGPWATDYGKMGIAKAFKQLGSAEAKSAAAVNAFSRDGAVLTPRSKFDGEPEGFVEAQYED